MNDVILYIPRRSNFFKIGIYNLKIVNNDIMFFSICISTGKSGDLGI